ncbi:hypothetical protein BVX98_02115 [bacterium F11]|nr:hypothetical protein BVX98_02115 [bacterium F11]
MKHRLKDWGTTLGGYVFEILAFFARLLPISLRLQVIKNLGSFYGSIPHSQKKTTKHNLKQFLNVSDKQLKKMTNQVFQNFALTLHDFFFPDDVKLDMSKGDMLKMLRAKEKGFMVLTFHLGNWEFGARVLREWGWPISAVYQPYQNKKFKKVFESRRTKGVNFIPVGNNAALKVTTALRRGDVVAMVGDHPFGEEGTWVDLLGSQIRLPKGPVVLAAKERKPILIGTVVRKGPCSYSAEFASPLYPRDRSRKGIEKTVQEVADIYGRFLQQYPTQWYRFRQFDSKA